jgi:hypothetical protein
MFVSNLIKVQIPDDMIESNNRQQYETLLSGREKQQAGIEDVVMKETVSTDHFILTCGGTAPYIYVELPF